MLGEVGEVRVGRRWPAGRPGKRCSICVMEYMNLLGVEEHVTQDRLL